MCFFLFKRLKPCCNFNEIMRYKLNNSKSTYYVKEFNLISCCFYMFLYAPATNADVSVESTNIIILNFKRKLHNRDEIRF